jgi:hypothetical protein
MDTAGDFKISLNKKKKKKKKSTQLRNVSYVECDLIVGK